MSRTWRRIPAERVTWRAGDPLLLEGDGLVRIIVEGSLGLFSVPARDGAAAGPRRVLQRLGAGHAVFSTPVRDLHPLRLGVAPVHEAAVRRLSLAALWRARESEEATVDGLIAGWIELLAGLISDAPVPKLPVRVSSGATEERELDAGQALCAERQSLIWLRVESGELQFLGHEKLLVGSSSGILPLDARIWVVATQPTVVTTCGSHGIEDVAAVEAGLALLQSLALRHLLAQREAEVRREKARLRRRQLDQEFAKTEALHDLAAVLEPRRVPIAGGVDPLMRAVTVVGRDIGVTIKPPMKSERPGAGEEIEAIARASRVRARRVRLSNDWWHRDCGALLAFTVGDDRRPVALTRGRAARYEIYDPSDDSLTPVTQREARRLGGEAWMFYRPLPEGRLQLGDLLRFSLRGRGRDIGMALFGGVLATVLGMLTPLATAVVMDTAIPDANRRLLLELGGGLMAAALGMILFQLSQGLLLLRLGMASEASTQAALWDRLLRLRPSFFRRFSSGDLQSRVGAVSEIARELSGVTLSSLFAGFLALLNLLLLLYYSPTLTALALAIAAVVVVFTATVGVFVRRNLRELLDREGKLFGLVVQIIHGVGKLRVAGAGERAYTHWLKKYTETLRLWTDSYRLEDRVYLFNQMLPGLSGSALFLVAHGQLSSAGGGLSLGIFLAFNAAFGAFLGGAISLSNTGVALLDVFAKGRRVKPILEAEPEVDTSKTDPGRLTGQLRLDKVQFRYGDEGPLILDRVALHAEPGEFVALVGPSGSGKSTTLRLLLGFEAPVAGTVSYDGQDLANLDVLAVRRQIGVVLQSGQLDAGSIFDNIACGSVLSLDEAWAAAEDAGLGDDIRDMPMGMHTVLSVAGGNLSGGQRQRLLIARALARRPRILLFDEATSALDNRTQAIVSRSLERLKVTRIVVAHRLSTIRNADRIYVFENGRIVQSGRFRELMAEEESLFARTMRRQLA